MYRMLDPDAGLKKLKVGGKWHDFTFGRRGDAVLYCVHAQEQVAGFDFLFGFSGVPPTPS